MPKLIIYIFQNALKKLYHLCDGGGGGAYLVFYSLQYVWVTYRENSSCIIFY